MDGRRPAQAGHRTRRTGRLVRRAPGRRSDQGSDLVVLPAVIGRQLSTLVLLGRPGYALTSWKRPDHESLDYSWVIYRVRMATPVSADDWQAVETAEDFIRFAEPLAVDYAEDERETTTRKDDGGYAFAAEGRWAQGAPGAWMEALAAWMEARYIGSSGAARRSEIEPPSWRTFAFILSRSRSYE